MISGGCQCGAVRYRVQSLSKASICHCRMCQKAFGNFFAPLTTAHGLQWIRKEPDYFQSSNKVTRGFCNQCGTPLTYDWGGDIEISIGSLDDPELAPPLVQVNPRDKLTYADELSELPVRTNTDGEVDFLAKVKTHQHLDHDTEHWPLEGSR